MLTSIQIVNFQSHKRTSITTGMFTVITGPSNAGKSSVVRAADLVVHNAGHVRYVRRGVSSCAVVLAGEDPQTGTRWAAGIERTAKGGSRYRLRIGDGQPQEYTKLQGKVPAEAAELLRLGELNFAGQIEGPYLLGVPAAEVARRLGELTNVSMLFRAAAEAGRARKQADRDLKGAEGRLEQLREQLREFDGLPGQETAIGQAEAAAAQAAVFARDLARLGQLIERAETAAAALAQARQAAEACAPPDLTQIERGLARYTRLTEMIGAHDDAALGLERWTAAAALAVQREQAAHQAVHDALATAGQCPLCGQEIAA